MQVQRLNGNNINYKALLRPKFLNAKEKAVFASLGAVGWAQNIKYNADFKKSFKDFNDPSICMSEDDTDFFDPEYYEAYYNIDLGLANSKAFRDEELFNPLIDEETQAYSEYDYNDLPVINRVSQRYAEESIADYNVADTIINQQVLPLSVTNPWIKFDNDININEKYQIIHNPMKTVGIRQSIMQKILEVCIRQDGEFRIIDSSLLNLSVNLYKNSGEWNETEEQIIRLIKKKAKNKADKIDLRAFMVKKQLRDGLPNEEILELLIHPHKNTNKDD